MSYYVEIAMICEDSIILDKILINFTVSDVERIFCDSSNFMGRDLRRVETKIVAR